MGHSGDYLEGWVVKCNIILCNMITKYCNIAKISVFGFDAKDFIS